jgi:amino acid adenylation domain-containing protein
MRVEDFLFTSSRAAPEKIALIAGDQKCPFCDLNERADQLARTLRTLGLQRGDRVVSALENSIEAAVSFFAILKAGGIFVPLSPQAKPARIESILRDCTPRLMICDSRLAANATLLDAFPDTKVIVAELGKGFPLTQQAGDQEESFPPHPAGIALDIAMIIYTSGSTGIPKGVVMTHQNVVTTAKSIMSYLENTADDVILNVLPFWHNYGLYHLLTATAAAATLVVERSFAFPARILELAERHSVTALPLVPTMANVLLQMKDLTAGRIPTLRYLTNAASPLSAEAIQGILALFPGARFYSMYGLTECGRATYLAPDELTRRPQSVGQPIPGTEAWIVDDDGHRVASGVVGELVIRGPHLMKGYWKNEPETAKSLQSGPFPWEKVLHTGDLFRADQDGYLYFVGRKDDVIKINGEKVSPKQIEDVIASLGGVRDVAVVAALDPVSGLRLSAIIIKEPHGTLTANDILRHCRQNLDAAMIPSSVEFRDANLPRSETGKLNRRQLAPH